MIAEVLQAIAAAVSVIKTYNGLDVLQNINQTTTIGGNNMLGSFGIGMKSARVGDQIDAEVVAGKTVLANTKMTAQQFDFIETQLQQFAQMLGQADPMAAMQFQNLQQQINNIQAQIINGITQAEQSFQKIDTLTDRIQN